MFISITQLRKNIFDIFNNTIETDEPVYIKTKKGNAVIISQKELEDLKETIHLMSNKTTYNNIIKGMQTPIEECISNDNLF